MALAIISIIIAIVLSLLLIKMNFKASFIVMSVITVCTTVGLLIISPKMHDRISIEVIDYLIKFNSDGSMTTTKQITTEVLKEVQK